MSLLLLLLLLCSFSSKSSFINYLNKYNRYFAHTLILISLTSKHAICAQTGFVKEFRCKTENEIKDKNATTATAPSTQNQEHSFHANVFGLKVFWCDYFNRVLLTFISYLRVNYLCISSLPSNGQSVQVTNTFFTPFVFTKFSLFKIVSNGFRLLLWLIYLLELCLVLNLKLRNRNFAYYFSTKYENH